MMKILMKPATKIAAPKSGLSHDNGVAVVCRSHTLLKPGLIQGTTPRPLSGENVVGPEGLIVFLIVGAIAGTARGTGR